MTTKPTTAVHSSESRPPEPPTPQPSRTNSGRSQGTPTDAATEGMRDVALEYLEPDAANVRKAFPAAELEELANTLKRDGVLQPLLVRPHPENRERFVIIAGERRFRAASMAGLTTVPVIVRQAEQVRGLQLIENVHRSDLSTLEKADGIAAVMKEEGLDEKAVATRLGFASDREVRRHLQLHRAPQFLREALRDGVRVEVSRDGATRTVTRALDYRTALEVVRIYNHYVKADFTTDKQVAVSKTKRVLERAVALGWTRDDFEEFAASLGKPRRGGRRYAGRALYRETPRTFTVDLKRAAENRSAGPEAIDELISRLESLLSNLRESKARPETSGEASTSSA